METGELRQLRKMASLPQPDPSFEEELEYGIRLKLTDDAVEYAVMVTRHPEEERFLLVVSMLNRRYWIIDLKALEIQEDNHELEILFELPKNRCTAFSDRRLYLSGVGEVDLLLFQREGARGQARTIHQSAEVGEDAQGTRQPRLPLPQAVPALQ